jgi:hypothetical protein
MLSFCTGRATDVLSLVRQNLSAEQRHVVDAERLHSVLINIHIALYTNMVD